jgi:hypothetical protein
MGGVDLIPIHPLSDGHSLEECGILARRLAARLSTQVPYLSIASPDFFPSIYQHKDRDWLRQQIPILSSFRNKFRSFIKLSNKGKRSGKGLCSNEQLIELYLR